VGQARHGWLLTIAIVAAAIFAIAAAGAQAPAADLLVEDFDLRVVDAAKIIDPATRHRIEGWLAELEQKTGAQVKVLTVRSTEGDEFFDFVQRHFRAWKLGQKKKNNGALIALTVAERQVRIHTGYGLEGALPDSWCGSLAQRVAKTYFAQGRYAEGLSELTVAVVKRVADDAGVTVTGLPEPRATQPEVREVSIFWVLALILIVFVVLQWIGRQNRYQRRWGGGLWDALYWGSVLNDMGRSRGGWSTSGGGFGGFGGGGGGGFGGSVGGGGSSGGGGGGASW